MACLYTHKLFLFKVAHFSLSKLPAFAAYLGPGAISFLCHVFHRVHWSLIIPTFYRRNGSRFRDARELSKLLPARGQTSSRSSLPAGCTALTLSWLRVGRFSCSNFFQEPPCHSACLSILWPWPASANKGWITTVTVLRSTGAHAKLHVRLSGPRLQRWIRVVGINNTGCESFLCLDVPWRSAVGIMS